MGKIAIGDRLAGRWEVLEEHPGGMGIVYVLRDDEGNLAAAKTIRDEFLGEARVARRFDVELRTWIGLGEHPNLVEARDTFEVDGRPFLLLEYVAGLTLGDLLARTGPLLPAEALDYALGLCSAMVHAESSRVAGALRGIVHRDLKPSNVFVTPARRARVSDFGIVKVFHRDGAITDEGSGLGTPWYVSPEQLRDARTTDGRGDIYSTGAILYEMLVGEPPLKAATVENQVYNILREPAPSPRLRNPDVDEDLAALVLRCLEKDRERRFANFATLALALEAALRHAMRRPVPVGATGCAGCGHVSVRGDMACPLDGADMRALDAAYRYVPVEDPGRDATDGDRPAGDRRVRIDGVQVRPRVPRTGRPLTIEVLVANPGTEAVTGCVVPFTLPDADAFRRVGEMELWRGDVDPSPAGAPRRVWWEVLPLRPGRYAVAPPRVVFRDASGTRREARFEEPTTFEVEADDLLPLVGRERETARLQERLAGAASGRASAVVLYGGPGSGKTRMLDELEIPLKERGFRTLRGKGLERAGQAMRSLHEALRGYFGVDDPAVRRETLTARVVDGLDPLFGRDPEMVEFLSTFLAGGAPPAEQQGDFLWMRFFGGACRREPLAILLDDVHYGEFETLDLLAALVARAREDGWRLLVVLASRRDDPDERAQRRIEHLEALQPRFARDEGLEVVELGPLEPADVALLLDAAFPGNTFGVDAPFLAGTLCAQTEGNPFFLGETFEQLRQARGPDGEPLLDAAPGGWAVNPSLTPEYLAEVVPDAVEEAVEGRLGQIAGDTLEVLEWAAVIGEEFEVDLLQEVAGGAERVDPALEEFERLALVTAVDADLERYRFSHSLLPHVVERRIGTASARRLKRLHGAVADALVRLHGPRRARRLGLRLSRHQLHAGRRREAFQALVDAARRLVRAQLFPRALSTLTHAAELLDGGLKPSRSLLREYQMARGETARILGRYDEAAEAFRAVIELAGGSASVTDRDALAVAYSKMGKVHEARGQVTDALYCYGVGMGLREDAGDRFGVALSMVNIGTAYALAGEDGRAEEYLLRALALAKETRNRPARATANIQLGHLARAAGDLDAARRWYRRGHGLFRGLRNRRGQAMALNGLGHVALGRGQHERAEKAYLRALEIRRTIGDREGLANCYNNLGIVAERRRDPDGAVTWYRRSLALHRAIGSRRGIAGSGQNLGEALLRAGELGAALEAIEAAVEAWRTIADRAGLASALVSLARTLTLAGRPSVVGDLLEEAEREAEASGSREARALARAARAENLVAAGRHREAETLLAPLPIEGLTPAAVAEVCLAMASARGIRASGQQAEEALEQAEAAVARALEAGEDDVLLVRWLLVRANAALARGERALAAAAARDAVEASREHARGGGPRLREALAILAEADDDAAERAQAARRGREVTEELRARGYAC